MPAAKAKPFLNDAKKAFSEAERNASLLVISRSSGSKTWELAMVWPSHIATKIERSPHQLHTVIDVKKLERALGQNIVGG
jgi:hypothetical protein